MQGRLLGRSLAATLRTECAETGRALEIRVDSDLGTTLLTEGAQPVVSVPLIDLRELRAQGVDYIYDAL